MARPEGVYSSLPLALAVVLAVVAPLGYAMTGITGLAWVVPGAVIWTSLFAFAAVRSGRSVFTWALVGGTMCGTIWALGEVLAHHLIRSGVGVSVSVPVAVLSAGLGGGALIGATLGRGEDRSDDLRLSFAAALLGAGLGAAAGLYFATNDGSRAIGVTVLIVVGLVGGLTMAIPGRSIGLRFRPAVLFFEDLWPYLREMAVPLAAFAAGYLCLAVAFAGFYGTVWRLDPDAFAGLPAQPGFWDFVFFSLMTASSANTPVSAISSVAQVLVALEVTIGLGWLIVVFGALSAHLAPRLSQIAEALHSRR